MNDAARNILCLCTGNPPAIALGQKLQDIGRN
jgi:hypothetical protein